MFGGLYVHASDMYIFHDKAEVTAYDCILSRVNPCELNLAIHSQTISLCYVTPVPFHYMQCHT